MTADVPKLLTQPSAPPTILEHLPSLAEYNYFKNGLKISAFWYQSLHHIWSHLALYWLQEVTAIILILQAGKMRISMAPNCPRSYQEWPWSVSKDGLYSCYPWLRYNITINSPQHVLLELLSQLELRASHWGGWETRRDWNAESKHVKWGRRSSPEQNPKGLWRSSSVMLSYRHHHRSF